MGIFKRVKRIAVADMNSTLDKLEEPISMVKQYIRELEGEIEKAQSALAKQLYFEQKHEEHIEQVQKMIADRKRQQQLAIDKNNDEMAKLAIQDRLENEKKLEVLKQQLIRIKNQTEQLKAQVIKLRDAYTDLQNRKAILYSRANTAKTTNRINQTLASSQSKNIINGFARMEDKVLRMEAHAYAYDYVNETELQSAKTFSPEVEEEFMKAKEATAANQ
ncbi:PspA/IM30 family protein [Metabacillus niabensis]|uniref:Phage shock protein A n=1 Tax=Metabacillus niabensis TaxID=324854 RepID=A0ABT9Z069_9BACI|nr:PspA/IM30 family protein [Metabacillus niabensis]MDQ0225420.1 phage shock protein A [Metabacillus niabensis]